MSISSEELKKLKDTATQVRRDVIRMTNGCGSGHPGGAMGCAEYFVALYLKEMKHNPTSFDMDAKDEDVFILSNGHISAGLYSTLARSGYFDPAELATHRMIDSRLQGHPATAKNLPGVRVATGSLGQGLSVACGIAQVKKLNKDDRQVFVLMGDGEQQEGQVWEAAMYAAHNNIDNVIAAIDYNNAQIDGLVDDILSLGDLSQKWKSFGWDVLEIEDGNNMEQVLDGIDQAKSRTGKGKPVMILLKTQMGFGVDFMQGGNAWHGKATNAEETEKALAQLESSLSDY